MTYICYLFKKLCLMITEIIKKVYEKKLEREILAKRNLPKHIMVVADMNFVEHTLKKFLRWCEKFNVKEVTVCVKGNKKEVRSYFDGSILVNLIIGYNGKEEIADAVRSLAELVEKGELNPEDVTEKDIEKFLKVKNSPDLIVRAGNVIPEFLIWQNIYSELYFIDINWRNFRYIDFLRCLREYQRRERRYGR